MTVTSPHISRVSEDRRYELSQISELVAQLVRELNAGGSNVGNALKPGVSRTLTSTMASKFPYELTSELLDLYEACNGLEERVGFDDFLIGFRLLQIEEAVGMYDYLMEQRGDPDDDYYRASWFPIMWSHSGGVKAVECAPIKTRGCIVDIDAESGNSIHCVSIERMLTTIIQCWKEGAFFADGDFVDIDDEKFAEICERLNPVIPDLE